MSLNKIRSINTGTKSIDTISSKILATDPRVTGVSPFIVAKFSGVYLLIVFILLLLSLFLFLFFFPII